MKIQFIGDSTVYFIIKLILLSQVVSGDEGKSNVPVVTDEGKILSIGYWPYNHHLLLPNTLEMNRSLRGFKKKQEGA